MGSQQRSASTGQPDGLVYPPPRGRRPSLVWLVLLLPVVAAAVALPMLRDTTPRFAFLAVEEDGRPVRWNPCEPIAYVVNPDGAPPGAVGDLERALEAIGEASGLRFTGEGPTDEAPQRDRPPYQPERYGHRWAPVLIAWVSEDDPGLDLEPAHYGRAGPVAVTGSDGRRVYVSGQIIISRERFPRQRALHRTTLKHEVGHVVGLGHVDDARELMNPQLSARAMELGAGDREGLRRLGPDAGCLEVPQPASPHLGRPEASITG